ncbi:MAG TPA: hypothetical protein VF572_04220 [Candidatus Saccharimonadales bacterium]|jgi:hypothetical protein
MEDTASERRMAENEVYFRQHNERIQREFFKLKQIADAANQGHLVKVDDTPLHFMCECSDENCQARIKLTPSEYENIHQKRNQFILIAGHDSPIIERVVDEFDGYIIVQKRNLPPESVSHANRTDVHNT